MAAYLRVNPPARSQFRSPRRQSPSGVTCIHTAESVLDLVAPDTGAENVAAWMSRRTTPGSYHDLVDSDSVVHLVDYADEAYQDGSGSNPHALSISFALKTSDWVKLTSARRNAFLEQGAAAFRRQQDWLKANGHPTTPLRRITKAQSDQRVPGFIGHGERDPQRRSDPGADFPWHEFLLRCIESTPNQEDVLNADQEAKLDRKLDALLAAVGVVSRNVDDIEGGVAGFPKLLQQTLRPGPVDVAALADALAERLGSVDAEKLADRLTIIARP